MSPDESWAGGPLIPPVHLWGKWGCHIATEEEEFKVELRKLPRRNHRDGYAAMKRVKLNIPSFQGKSEPETYLEWKHRMELVFNCHYYIEVQKVKLVVMEFSNYTITW